MSNKLLNDVASILADVGITYGQADRIAEILVDGGILSKADEDEWINTASNAPSAGECGC